MPWKFFLPAGLRAVIVMGMEAYREFEINFFQDEDGYFTAQMPAIPGCIASGKTLPVAYRNAVDAIESCLEARRKVSAMKFLSHGTQA